MDKTFGTGFLVGYIISVVLVVAISMSCCMPLGRFKKKKKVTMKTPMMTSLMERCERKRIRAIQEILKLEEFIVKLSFTSIYSATNSFGQENVIGIGRMGTMYRGTLPCGSFIAVKRLYGCQYLEERFISKLMMLSKLKHNNIVPLLGFSFCMESKETLVIYKYMSNDNLYNWLHPVKGESNFMDWPMRVFIAIKVAKGLAYLHDNCAYAAAHLNMRSNCILLNKNFEPKISSFGRAMFLGKNARDFYAGLGESDIFKKDVYGFGVLLLELITGKDPNSDRKYFHSLKETSVEQINNDHLPSFLSNICYVDKFIVGKGFDLQILHCLRVAFDCLQPLPNQRPRMIEVYKVLRSREITNPSKGFADMLDTDGC